MNVKETVALTLSDGPQVDVSIFVFKGDRHHKATVLTSGFLLLFLTAQMGLRSVKASQPHRQ